MADIGYGYGSECHLLRYLGRHRNEFDKQVLSAIGQGGKIEWVDFPFEPNKTWADAEWKGLDFLSDRKVIQTAWKEFWPQSGNVQNWDAVGWLNTGNNKELLLVEAKAHTEELISSCGAKPEGGLDKINKAFTETKQAFGVAGNADWLKGFYQYANRLAVLHFLTKHDIPTRLIFIYFIGDKFPESKADCPQTKEAWLPILTEQNRALGLTGTEPSFTKVSKVFLHVSGSI